MPFALLIIGLLLVVTSAKDTHVQFGKQVASDFTGQNNFFVWILAVGIVGFVGYVEKLRPISNMFLALILLAMFLSNSRRGDILTLVKNGVMNPVPPAKASATPATTTTSGILSQGMAGGLMSGIPKFPSVSTPSGTPQIAQPDLSKQLITPDSSQPTMSDMFSVLLMFL